MFYLDLDNTKFLNASLHEKYAIVVIYRSILMQKLHLNGFNQMNLK